MTTVYKFKAYYTDSGVGAVQDPAPTCTVINMADDSKLADAQATTASTNMPGLYSYEYSGADGLDCVAWFKTTDTGCDVKELASYVSEKITTNLNADVAGVETKLDTVDTNVDSILADTGTDGVKIAADAITASTFDESTAFPIKSADTGATQIARVGADSDTLETLSDQMDAIDADVWSYAARTLTQSAASVAAVLAGSDITIQRGDTESISLTDIGALTGYTKLWFTVKGRKTYADTLSTIQIEKTGGLLYLNGAVASTASDGSITISDEATGDISIVIKAAATAVLEPGAYYYDIQMLSASGVNTMTYGTFTIEGDVTRTVA